MSTKQEVIDAIAEVATAAAALDSAVVNVRDAFSALDGAVVGNPTVVANGTSRAALLAAASSTSAAIAPLVSAVDAKVTAAAAVANALT